MDLHNSELAEMFHQYFVEQQKLSRVIDQPNTPTARVKCYFDPENSEAPGSKLWQRTT